MNRRDLLRKAGAASLALVAGTGLAAADAAGADEERIAPSPCDVDCCRDCPGNCFHCNCEPC